VPAEQPQATLRADARHVALHLVRIDAGRVGSLEACEDGTIGAVACAGERERSIQAHIDLPRACEQAGLLEVERELARRAHRAHGVRARRTDPDLEDVEYAECAHCSVNDSRVALPPTAAVLMLSVCSVAKRCR